MADILRYHALIACQLPLRGRSAELVDTSVCKSLSWYIPDHHDFLRFLRRLWAPNCRDCQVPNFLLLKLLFLFWRELRNVSPRILLGNLPLKLSRCVSNELRLSHDRVANRVLAKAKAYLIFHNIHMLEEISGKIGSLATSSESWHRTGKDERTNE